MKKKLLASLMVFGASVVFAANNSPSDQSKQKDEEVVAYLIVLDQNEIAAAEAAKKQAHNPEVKKFAKWMDKAHSTHLHATKKLSKKTGLKPMDTADTKTMQDDNKKMLHQLNSLKADDFDKAYMDDMVKGHNQALTAIDQDLKNVSNPKLKKHLMDTRDHVATHLEKAKAIQQQLNKS